MHYVQKPLELYSNWYRGEVQTQTNSQNVKSTATILLLLRAEWPVLNPLAPPLHVISHQT